MPGEVTLNSKRKEGVQNGAVLFILTYLLTPWNRVLLETLIGSQIVKKLSAFYGNRSFMTAFITLIVHNISPRTWFASDIYNRCMRRVVNAEKFISYTRMYKICRHFWPEIFDGVILKV